MPKMYPAARKSTSLLQQPLDYNVEGGNVAVGCSSGQ